MQYKSALEIIKRYRWRSIFFSYFKMLACIILIPIMILSFIVYSFYISSLRKETSVSFENSAYKTYSKIHTELDNLQEKAFSMRNNSHVIEFIDNPNPFANNINTTSSIQKTADYITSLFSSIDCVQGFQLYSSKNNYVLSNTVGADIDNSRYKNIINTALSGEKIFKSNVDNSECISLAYNVNTESYQSPSGLFLINLNSRLFHEYIFSNAATLERLYITNSDFSDIIYSPDTNQENTEFKKIFELEEIKNAENSNSITVYKHGNLFCLFPLQEYGLNIILELPNANNISVLTLASIAVIICIVTLIISLLLSVYSSIHLYDSIASIITDIELNDITSKVNDFNEIHFIKNNLLRIINDKSNLEKELTDKLTALKQMQTFALQTQINPHFIFNSLNVVNLMIMKTVKCDTRPSRIIALISDIINNVLNTKSIMTTLADEISYAKKYIEIELIKSNYSFDVEWDIEPEAMTLHINKFILQPILENSINHGFKLLKDRRAKLLIKIYTENKQLFIIISDNGHGIDDNTYSSLIAKINDMSSFQSSPHIGLTNVSQRLKLVHGNKAELRVIRTNPGTTIHISIPITNQI